jgi:hypothetical protein
MAAMLPTTSEVYARSLVDSAEFSSIPTQDLVNLALLSISYKSKILLRLLLERRSATILAYYDIGRMLTFFQYVIMNMDAEIVEMLIEYGADVNQTEANRGRTPLMMALEWGKVEVVRVLLSQPNIDLDAVSNSGLSVIHYANRLPDASLIEEIFLRGANPGPRNRNTKLPSFLTGEALLRYAALFSDPEKIRRNLLSRRLPVIDEKSPPGSFATLTQGDLVTIFSSLSRETFSESRLVCPRFRNACDEALLVLPLEFFRF